MFSHQLNTWIYGAYLARVEEGGMSAELWLTDAPSPRTRWVSSGCRSSCESGCHGCFGKSEIQNRRSRIAAHRCPICRRTRRVTSRWSLWKSGSDSGWPSRTALRGSASMTRLSHAVCSRCSHYLRTWKEKRNLHQREDKLLSLGQKETTQRTKRLNFGDLATPTFCNQPMRSRKSLIAHISMFMAAEGEASASLIDSILSVRISHQHPVRPSPSLPRSLIDNR